MQASLQWLLAFMIKQVKVILVYILLFNVLQDALQHCGLIRTILRVKSEFLSILILFTLVFAKVSGSSVLQLPGEPVIFVENGSEDASSDFGFITLHSEYCCFTRGGTDLWKVLQASKYDIDVIADVLKKTVKGTMTLVENFKDPVNGGDVLMVTAVPPLDLEVVY